MNYQKKLLADMSNVGAPAPLPKDLVGLKDISLADLSWADGSLGYRVYGYFPVADPVPSGVPLIVSRLQAKLALLANSMLDAVDTAIDNAKDPALTVYWQEASQFHRDHPALVSVTKTLGMSKDQVDALFIQASAIT